MHLKIFSRLVKKFNFESHKNSKKTEIKAIQKFRKNHALKPSIKITIKKQEIEHIDVSNS